MRLSAISTSASSKRSWRSADCVRLFGDELYRLPGDQPILRLQTVEEPEQLGLALRALHAGGKAGDAVAGPDGDDIDPERAQPGDLAGAQAVKGSEEIGRAHV